MGHSILDLIGQLHSGPPIASRKYNNNKNLYFGLGALICGQRNAGDAALSGLSASPAFAQRPDAAQHAHETVRSA
jgi:hypothetical protein